MHLFFFTDLRQILTAYVLIQLASSSFWPRHATMSPQAEVKFTHIEAYGLDVTYPSHGRLQVRLNRLRSVFTLLSLISEGSRCLFLVEV